MSNGNKKYDLSKIPDIYPTTTEEILRQAITGELPRTVSEERKRRKKGIEEPKRGVYDLSLIPTEEPEETQLHDLDKEYKPLFGETFGETEEAAKLEEAKTLKGRMKAVTEQIEQNLEQSLVPAYRGFKLKEGIQPKDIIRTVQGLIETGFLPVTTGFTALETSGKGGERLAKTISYPFELAGKLGKGITEGGFKVMETLGLKTVDKDTQDAVNDLAELIGSVAIPAGVLHGLKGLKGAKLKTEVEKIKTNIPEIKNNIEEFKSYEEPKIIGQSVKEVPELTKKAGLYTGKTETVKVTPSEVKPPEIIAPREQKGTIDEIVDTHNKLVDDTKYYKDPELLAVQEVLTNQLKKRNIGFDYDKEGKIFVTERRIVEPTKGEPTQLEQPITSRYGGKTTVPYPDITEITPTRTQERIITAGEIGRQPAEMRGEIGKGIFEIPTIFSNKTPTIDISEFMRNYNQFLVNIEGLKNEGYKGFKYPKPTETEGIALDRAIREGKITDVGNGEYHIKGFEEPTVEVVPPEQLIGKTLEKGLGEQKPPTPEEPIPPVEPTEPPKQPTVPRFKTTEEATKWAEENPDGIDALRERININQELYKQANATGNFREAWRKAGEIQLDSEAINHAERVRGKTETPSQKEGLVEGETERLRLRKLEEDRLASEQGKTSEAKRTGWYLEPKPKEGLPMAWYGDSPKTSQGAVIKTGDLYLGLDRDGTTIATSNSLEGAMLKVKQWVDAVSELPQRPNEIVKQLERKSERIISDNLNQWADDTIKKRPTKLYANPLEFYGEKALAYTIKGARFIEDGIIVFKDWAGRMIDEFGADVAPYLKELYGKANEYLTKQKEIRVVEPILDSPPTEKLRKFKEQVGREVEPTELQKELRKALYDATITSDAKALIDYYTDLYLPEIIPLRRKARDTFREKAGRVVEWAGKAGGELVSLFNEGDGYKTRLINHTRNYVNNIYEAIEKAKLTKGEANQLYQKVIQALEDRTNAETILAGDKLAGEVYKNAWDFYDTFLIEIEEAYKQQGLRVEAQKLRYEQTIQNNSPLNVIRREEKILQAMMEDYKNSPFRTIENYATKIKASDFLNKIYEDAAEIGFDQAKKPLFSMDFITEKSRFLEERTGDIYDREYNLPHNMTVYLHSMSRNLAYAKAMDYYRYRFWDDMPRILQQMSRQGGADVVKKFTKTILNPELPSEGLRKVNKVRNVMYQSFLWNNLKASIVNGIQRQLATLYLSPDAVKLADELWSRRKQIADDTLNNLIQDIDIESPATLKYYEDVFEGELQPRTNKFSESMDKINLFKIKEIGNWRYSQIAGIAKTIIDTKSLRPQYQSLIQRGIKPLDAVAELIKNPEIYRQSLRQAVDLSSVTQVSPNIIYRPEFYDKPLHRTWAMFTRFPFQQLQILGRTLGDLDGAFGTRGQNIFRRGLTGDAIPAEVLMETQLKRMALDKTLKSETRLDSQTRQAITKYRDFLKANERDLVQTVRGLEPMAGNKGAMVMKWTKYFGTVYALSLAWQYINNAWEQQVDKMIKYGSKDKDEYDTIPQMLWTALVDVQPLPFFSLNPHNFMQTPLTPDLEWTIFGNFNRRGLVKSGIRYAETMFPPAYFINRYSGGKLNRVITDFLVPKKNQKRIEQWQPNPMIEQFQNQNQYQQP